MPSANVMHVQNDADRF